MRNLAQSRFCDVGLDDLAGSVMESFGYSPIMESQCV